MVRRGSRMYVVGVGWKSQIFPPAARNSRPATRDPRPLVKLSSSHSFKSEMYYRL